jgi:hypothetical protein
MKAFATLICTLLVATTSTSLHANANAAAVEAPAAVPTPVPVPFYGESLDPVAVTGDIVALTLSNDGTYRRRHCYVTPCIDAPTEIGPYTITSSGGKQVIHFFNVDDDETYEFDKYEVIVGQSHELWLRKWRSSRWVAVAPQPDEQMCDGTGGHWRDDDANPYTGLYCDCAADHYWNAAAGGCIPRPQ